MPDPETQGPSAREMEDAMRAVSALVTLEAIGGGKSKYAHGRRDLAKILLPHANTLRTYLEQQARKEEDHG